MMFCFLICPPLGFYCLGEGLAVFDLFLFMCFLFDESSTVIHYLFALFGFLFTTRIHFTHEHYKDSYCFSFEWLQQFSRIYCSFNSFCFSISNEFLWTPLKKFLLLLLLLRFSDFLYFGSLMHSLSAATAVRVKNAAIRRFVFFIVFILLTFSHDKQFNLC